MTDSRLTEYGATDLLPVFTEWADRHGVGDARTRFTAVLSIQDVEVLAARYTRSLRGHFKGEA